MKSTPRFPLLTYRSRSAMGKTAWQNLLTATKCHKFNFAFASPISCIILIAVAALTGITRNYFTNIVTKIAGVIGAPPGPRCNVTIFH